MNKRNLFTRNKKNPSAKASTEQLITCDTPELKDLIRRWTKNEGWEFEDFAIFSELVGIQPPLKLSGLNAQDNSFKCISATNNEVTMSVYFGDFFDFCSTLSVRECEETREYIVHTNLSENHSVPSVTLERRCISKNGKELNSYYCRFFCIRTLKIDSTHTLKVEIDEPQKTSSESDIIVLRNCQAIEEYLLNLDNSLVVSQVYDKLCTLLGLTEENISNSSKVSISYIETFNKEERVRSKILVVNGTVEEYAILEAGETYHLSRDGSWKYLSDDGMEITYNSQKHLHSFSTTGTEYQIISATPSEIFSRVKAKISELMEFIK